MFAFRITRSFRHSCLSSVPSRRQKESVSVTFSFKIISYKVIVILSKFEEIWTGSDLLFCGRTKELSDEKSAKQKTAGTL